MCTMQCSSSTKYCRFLKRLATKIKKKIIWLLIDVLKISKFTIAFVSISNNIIQFDISRLCSEHLSNEDYSLTLAVSN